MAKEQVDWKAKYKEAAQEIERLERNQDAEVLRLAVSHLTLGLQGRSSALDTDLDQLRQALHGGAAALTPKLIQPLEKQIRALDAARDDTNKALVSELHAWATQIKKRLPLERPELTEVAELERTIPDSVEKLYRLPLLLKQLLALQEVVNSALGDGAQPQESHPQNYDETLRIIGRELVQLLGAMNFAEQGRKQALELIKEIEAGLTLEQMSDLLNRIIELAQKAVTTTNEDFENYLITLNTQLFEVQKFFKDSHKEQVVAGQAHTALDQQVRQDVDAIQQVVRDTNDLGQLKQSVATQLAGIVRAMDEFKRNEAARDGRLQQRYDALLEQVSTMEEETRRVKAHMEEERQKARTDALTGLPNRAAYDDHMQKEFERWTRYQQGFSVAVGDLDFFKKINDSYGHLAGDKVLRLVARVLQKQLRKADFIARFGGEEFVVLMPSTKAEEGAGAIDKLREVISQSPFNFHGKPVTITMSFGITEVHEGDTADTLFARADKALYQAKQEGRNRVCVA